MTTAATEHRRAVRAGPVAATAAPRARPGWATVVCWALLALALGWVLLGTLTHDVRDQRLVGDQASHLLQALSLSSGDHDLRFDAEDLEAWRDVGWTPAPYGLFLQRSDDGWAFAKPYGYSLYLAPFLGVLGVAHGTALANTLLLLGLAAAVTALLRLRYRGPTVPLTVGAFALASYAYLYAYPLAVELFLAILVAVTFLALLRPENRGTARLVLGMAVAAFLVTEKASLVPLLLPIGLVVLWRQTWPRRALLCAVGLAVLAVGSAPYLWASDGASWNPYGSSQRYYSPEGEVPLDGRPVASMERTTGDEIFTPGFLARAVEDPGARLRAAATYVAGRHTGVLPFIPVAVFLTALALARVRRWDAVAVAVGLGFGAYVAFHVLLFPGNYYGGGQALGNRYFLQVAPAAIALTVAAAVPRRQVAAAAVAGVVLGVAFLWPHHLRPDDALVRLDRTSPLQRLLPFEGDLPGADYFRCGAGVCPPS